MIIPGDMYQSTYGNKRLFIVYERDIRSVSKEPIWRMFDIESGSKEWTYERILNNERYYIKVV